MIKAFRSLDGTEAEFMFKVPALVCVLIAGADGDIDRKEIREAIAVASKNKNDRDSILYEYFQEVFGDFEDKLKIVIQSYPYESNQRTPILIEELAHVNSLWSKIPSEFAVEFHKMLLDLAQRIASSSGGWLGIKSVGPQEARYVKLPMINDPLKKY
jgi:hypothetical protein